MTERNSSQGQLANLTPFSSEYQPENRGRKKGSKNRSTILRELLELPIKAKDVNGAEVTMPTEVAVNLALIQKALKGDVQAVQEILNTTYGKLPDKIVSESEHEYTPPQSVEDAAEKYRQLIKDVRGK